MHHLSNGSKQECNARKVNCSSVYSAVTTKKVLGKKVSGKKSYQFETLFSRTFFSGSSMIYTKKSSEKSPIRGENA